MLSSLSKTTNPRKSWRPSQHASKSSTKRSQKEIISKNNSRLISNSRNYVITDKQTKTAINTFNEKTRRPNDKRLRNKRLTDDFIDAIEKGLQPLKGFWYQQEMKLLFKKLDEVARDIKRVKHPLLKLTEVMSLIPHMYRIYMTIRPEVRNTMIAHVISKTLAKDNPETEPMRRVAHEAREFYEKETKPLLEELSKTRNNIGRRVKDRVKEMMVKERVKEMMEKFNKLINKHRYYNTSRFELLNNKIGFIDH